MIPRIIWMFWDNETALIKKIKRHNLKLLTKWDVRFLNDKTVHKYIHSFPVKVTQLIPQQKSDWIRLYLIMTYGGIWSDASIIFNSDVELEKIWKMNYEFMAFHNVQKKINNIYPVIENSFFMSYKNGKIVTLWYHEYNKAIEEGFIHYRNRILSKTLAHYSKGTYLIAYVCLQHVLRTHKLPPMLLLPVDKSLYKLHKKTCKNKSICVMNTLKNKPHFAKQIPFIKLSGRERNTNINIDSYFM